MLRGCCRLLCTRYQPVFVAPVWLCPKVCLGDCAVSCFPPRVVSCDGCACAIEQTVTLRVPVCVGADASLGPAQIFRLQEGEKLNGLCKCPRACLPDER